MASMTPTPCAGYTAKSPTLNMVPPLRIYFEVGKLSHFVDIVNVISLPKSTTNFEMRLFIVFLGRHFDFPETSYPLRKVMTASCSSEF
jgi:hypothetical protein